jgi:hypothetical protein
MVSVYLKGLSGVVGYLHRQVVLEQVFRLKKLIEKNIMGENIGYSK